MKAVSKVAPTRVEITLRPFNPLDFVQITALWERQEGRPLTAEEHEEWKAEENRLWTASQLESLQKMQGSLQVSSRAKGRRARFV